MNMFRKIQRFISALLAVLMLSLSANSLVHAGIVSTDNLVNAQQVALEREQVREWLARNDVREQLTGMGVDVNAAQARVDSMTAEEVRTLAANMDEMPAASGALEVAVLVLLILILLDVAGVTDIFPGI